MGFMDELKKLTQPYDDEDDFFEGADAPAFKAPAPAKVSVAQEEFESAFAGETAPRRQEADEEESPVSEGKGSIFGSLGMRRAKAAAQRDQPVSMNIAEAQFVYFSPKDFTDAKTLVGYLSQRHMVVMILSGMPADTARRMLDLCSGVALAFQYKISPTSGRTYFITPVNVQLQGVETAPPQMEIGGDYI